MSTKRFLSDLHGVSLTNGERRIWSVRFLNKEEREGYKICDLGSPIFFINLEENKIDAYTVKFVVCDLIYAAKKGTNNDYVPTTDRDIPSDFKCFHRGYYCDRTHIQLWYTDLVEASKALKRLSKGDAFRFLKEGDKIYLYLWRGDEVYEHTVSSTKSIDGYFLITIEDGRMIRMLDYNSYENTIGHVHDSTFDMTSSKNGLFCYEAPKITIYMNRADAEKTVQRRINNRFKKEEELKSKIGQQLVLKDNNDSILHFGDKVIYYGMHGLSHGIIVDENKNKIIVLDEKIRKENRAAEREFYEEHKATNKFLTPPVDSPMDGCFSVKSDAILLLK